MADYSTLTDAEVNAMLAEKMGLKGKPWVTVYCEICDGTFTQDFDPCTSRDDLAVVVEHISSSGLSELLDIALCNAMDEHQAGAGFVFLLTCPPRVIAEACLEVMEG